LLIAGKREFLTKHVTVTGVAHVTLVLMEVLLIPIILCIFARVALIRTGVFLICVCTRASRSPLVGVRVFIVVIVCAYTARCPLVLIGVCFIPSILWAYVEEVHVVSFSGTWLVPLPEVLGQEKLQTLHLLSQLNHVVLGLGWSGGSIRV
jgi:hypothetical protein